MNRRYTKPKRYDRHMFYVYEEKRYQVFVNIRRCEACYGQTVFQKRCPVCGRFLPSQSGIYLEIVRAPEIKLVK